MIDTCFFRIYYGNTSSELNVIRENRSDRCLDIGQFADTGRLNQNMLRGIFFENFL